MENVKNKYRDSRLEGGVLSSESRDSMSSDGDEFKRNNWMSEEYEYWDDTEDTDSGMSSDDFDLLELGEIGEEFCQVGNQCCSIPLELYELQDFTEILSLDSWNNCLSEEERFSLAEYLPAMDQETFTYTMKEIFSGKDFHFGSPLIKFFNMLKGGLCDPRVARYSQNLNFLMKSKHYHTLKNYQNSMVTSLIQVKDAWKNCNGYGIDERIRVLNLMRSQRSSYQNMEDTGSETESLERGESDDGLWTNSSKRVRPKMGGPALYGKRNAKGILKFTGSKVYVNQTKDAEKLTKKQIKERDVFENNLQDAGESAMFLQQARQSTVEGCRSNTKSRSQHLVLNGFPVDKLRGSQHLDFTMDQPRKVDDWDIRSKKWKTGEEFQTHIDDMGHDPKVKSYSTYPSQVNDQLVSSNYNRYNKSQDKIKRDSVNNGGQDMEELRGMGKFIQSYETESESSDQVDVEEDINPSRRKSGISSRALEDFHFSAVKSVPNPKKANGKKKGQIRDSLILHKNTTRNMVSNGHMKLEYGQKLHPPAERNQRGKVDRDCSVPRSNYVEDYSDDEEDELHVTPRLVNDYSVIDRLGKKDHERPTMSLLGCKSLSKKHKGKADLTCRDAQHESELWHSSPEKQTGETPVLTKRGKRNVEVESDSLINLGTSERVIAELEREPAKPFTLITPTVHSGFSFSIIHLLSAVRVAMITPLAEDFSEVGRPIEQNNENMVSCNPAQAKNLPSLTIQEIINRVRSNPGDPCILETPEPLQDLVRGVLKIFSSKTAPLGAKGWKTLVLYEKSSKIWSWIGPVSSNSSNPEIEEDISSTAWGLPHKMLVKLVDSFANWLKTGQETLQQIGSLPALPMMFMQPNQDEKERFRDLRAQRSLITIKPSSEEARVHFRKEEMLRYLVPDRAFSYTAADGAKSIVAPLRRCGGKLKSKIREHFMLKPDRPPYVTVLCIVRDAASRLPGGIGTRADVCTLIRDSQYIVENITDAEINQVASGALDRLHYERDPCVQYHSDRKLWVYLHRDREEEDFDDDGTSSTKNCRRPRKIALEHSDREDWF